MNQELTPLNGSKPRYAKVLNYDQASAKIIHEHTLINHRMTWMVLSEAFLLAGYFNLRPRADSVSATGGSAIHSYQEGISTILYSLVCAGIGLCAVFGFSFFAAFWAIRVWRLMCDDGVKARALTSRRMIHFFGDAPPAVVPWAILGSWFSIWYADKGEWLPRLTWYERVTPWGLLVVGGIIWLMVVREMFNISAHVD